MSLRKCPHELPTVKYKIKKNAKPGQNIYKQRSNYKRYSVYEKKILKGKKKRINFGS